MNEAVAFEAVKKELKPARFDHTVRVVDTAQKLAEQYHAPVKQVRLAAILHDIAKYHPSEGMKTTIRNTDWITDEWTEFGEAVLHAPAGAIYVKNELGIDDEEILLAILYHTTGRAKMKLIEKIIFLADYIEPGRRFSGIEEVRKRAEVSLDDACFLALSNTVHFLAKKHQPIFPDTLYAYNDLVPINKRRN
ncbi:bis(5'-nucleosyl)-tetraphosphatase (symmetrical) YqeK [Alteribacter populi]|uniref:bis(5'-nucleosyl)-tetraphosphatase (symmetrical) YqeK n=1 Tax=Alteribacter populi TaxID=2011011 RepID=UPI000BBB2B25|nr:bis(5'-nucleosyl)-tetraphosphatase (symmetrical) YqeK [Alteribacter populi]